MIIYNEKGFLKTNYKKLDGTDLDLRELIFYRSIDAPDVTIDGNNLDEYEFCDDCLIVIKRPTRHCKLCECCCSHFDHHVNT